MKKESGLKGLVIALAAVIILIAASKIISSFGSGNKDSISYVYDEAGVLSASTEKHIISSNASLQRQCGGQIVVACLKTTGDKDIADYATEMFSKLQIGDSKKNNGVLILLSIEEDAYWMLQGKGIEEVLSSGIMKLMMNEYLEPYFAGKNYDEGVKSLFNALIEHFEAMYSITVTTSGYSGSASASTGNPLDEPQSGQTHASVSSFLSGIAGAIVKILIFIAVAIVIIVILVIIAAFAGRGGSGTNSTPGSGSGATRTFVSTRRSTPGRFGLNTGGMRSNPIQRNYSGFTGFNGSRTSGGRSGGWFNGSGRSSSGNVFSGGSRGSSGSGGFSGGGGSSRGGGAGRR